MAWSPIPMKHINKLSKEDAYEDLRSELNDLTRWYFARGFVNRNELNALWERFKSKKCYGRYIKMMMKKEEENPFPPGYGFLLSNFLRDMYRSNATKDNPELDEVCNIYSDALDKMSKRATKRISKKFNMPKELAGQIAIILPGEHINPHNAWIFTQEFVRRLIALQAKANPVQATEGSTTTDTPTFDFSNYSFMKKLFKEYFGKDKHILVYVYAALLLDKHSITAKYSEKQMAVWDTITKVVLNGVEKLPFKAVQALAKKYTQRYKIELRRDGGDVRRRVVLSSLNYEECPKLVTVFSPDKYSKKELLKAEKKAKKKKKGKKGKK